MPLKAIGLRTPSSLHAAATGIALAALPVSSVLAAEVTLPPISLGAGVRSSFTHTDPDFGEDISDFELNNARIYVSGKVTENISLMLNTEYNAGGATPESMRVIDAVAQFSFSEQFNIWAGRFLPPSDRANMYGPFYANHWGVFRDGVQDGYPFETEGRNDGVMYWGQFGIAKISAGAFDVQGLSKGSSDVLYAGRVQLDFWDPESGYYLNSTYYGEKDLLALGIAAQTAAGDNAYSLDFLLEKKLANSGVVTIEAEYAKYDALGGYPSPLATNAGPIPYDSSDGYYVLGAYVFPQTVGIGKFQLVAKLGEATYDYVAAEVDQTTTELNLTYLIKDFNARVTLFYIDTSFDPNLGLDNTQIGVGLQVQI